MPLQLGKVVFSSDPRLDSIGVDLKDGEDLNQFRFHWSHTLSQFEPPLQFQQAYELEEQLDQSSSARIIQVQSIVVICLSVLVTAMSIVWSMNAALDSRVQQFGLLRSIGFTKLDVVLIPMIESLVRGVFAWSIACLVMLAVQQVTEWMGGGIFKYGVPIRGLGWSAFATLSGAFLATLQQLKLVLKSNPLDAIHCQLRSSHADFDDKNLSKRETVLRRFAYGGLATLLLVLASFGSSYYGSYALHETSALILVLVSIGAAFACSCYLFYQPYWYFHLAFLFHRAPTFALLLKLQFAQLGSRRPTIALALSASMCLFLSIQIWGNTLLEAFVPGGWLPDSIAFRSNGFSEEELERFCLLPSVNPERCVGLRIEQVRLSEDLLKSRERGTITRQDNVLVVGLDAAKAFGTETPLVSCRWDEGDRQNAMVQFQSGKGCIVVDHFLADSGLKIGDTVRFVPPRHKPRDYVEYEIVGALQMPGWHWETKQTAMRTRSHRTAAMIFVPDLRAKKDFSLPNYTHIWFDLAPDTIAQSDNSGRGLEEQVAAAWRTQQGSATSIDNVEGSDTRIQIVTAESIRQHVRSISKRWLWIMSGIPLVGMVVTMLSFVQLQMASLRLRSLETGVLRSIGFQKGELLFAWLGETVLIITYATVHSTLFAWLISTLALSHTQHFSFLGGIETPVRLPWNAVGWLGVFAGLLVVGGVVAPAVRLLKSRPWNLIAESGGASRY